MQKLAHQLGLVRSRTLEIILALSQVVSDIDAIGEALANHSCPDDEENRIPCPEKGCNLTYKTSASLYDHRRKKHNLKKVRRD